MDINSCDRVDKDIDSCDMKEWIWILIVVIWIEWILIVVDMDIDSWDIEEWIWILILVIWKSGYGY